jgi:hypothetical protein
MEQASPYHRTLLFHHDFLEELIQYLVASLPNSKLRAQVVVSRSEVVVEGSSSRVKEVETYFAMVSGW